MEHVLVQRNGSRATVVMDRPDVHNAFNDVVITELTDTFRELGNDPSVRVIVLSSTGKSFSAGADLNWMRRMIDYSRDENIRDAMALATLFRTIDETRKPVIARVHGAALGGGAGLVAVADIAIATERAKFAFSEVRLGIIPAVISPFVIAKIGAGAARRYFLTGERFTAQRALEIGLVSTVVAADEIDPTIDQLCDDIAQAAPEAVGHAKHLIEQVLATTDAAAADRLTAELIADRRASTEGQAGMRSFLEKRKPAWLEGDGGQRE
ncbi:MAG: enoyl-CoA hydratase-related protein [Planctomycetota bacterium]